jgi:acetyl-CoA carboxylase alpha subunit
MTTDYLDLVFEEFVELHGDKTFSDDRAIRTGFAKLDKRERYILHLRFFEGLTQSQIAARVGI